MELGYRLTVTDSKGNEILLSSMKKDTEESERSGDIFGASYKSNTINDEALSRSNDVRAEITVNGIISSANKAETCKLASWAKETDSDLVYRTVKLETYTATDENATLLRSYEIKDMFVLDYTEKFSDLKNDAAKDGSCGTFELYVVQKKGNYKQYIEAD